MTYMTRYLTSILSLTSSRNSADREKIIQLKKDVEGLKQETEELRRLTDEIALCIQQLAASMSTFILQSTTQKDPIDEALDSLWKKDDDGNGYLN